MPKRSPTAAPAPAAMTAAPATAGVARGLPVHSPAEMAPPGPAAQAAVPTAAATAPSNYYDLCCPNCSYEFVGGPFAATPNIQATVIRCNDCKGDYPMARYLEAREKRVEFYGEPVTCRCGTVYRPKQRGTGGGNPQTGQGGDWRACPKCGTNPPGQPQYSSLEDPNARPVDLTR